MEKKILKQLEARLSTRRDHLLKAIQRRLQECRDSGGYRLPDIIDMASLTSLDQLGMIVTETEVRALREIDDALSRIRSGSYGVCKNCGRAIRKDRLKALPYATLCVKCKEEEEEEFGMEAEAEKPVIPLEEATEASEEEPEKGPRSSLREPESGEYSSN